MTPSSGAALRLPKALPPERQAELVALLLDYLDGREREVITRRMADEQETLEAIGADHGGL